jgi:hypothetical protein
VGCLYEDMHRSNAPKVAASWDAVFSTPILGMVDFTWLPQMGGKARCIITEEVLLGEQGVHLVAGFFISMHQVC